MRGCRRKVSLTCVCIPPPPEAGRQEKLRIEVASSERWQRRNLRSDAQLGERLLKLKLARSRTIQNAAAERGDGAHHRRCAREGRTPLGCTTRPACCNRRGSISPPRDVTFVCRCVHL